jgi:Amidohydrolase family
MELQRAGNEGRFRALKLLLDKGAPLLLGTDAPNPFVIPGFAIHEELANLVRAGLSPFQALRCGTSEAARFMCEADEWGTIAAGRRADLLLLSANPLDRVEAVARPEAVLVNGFYLSRDQLDELLEERAVTVAATIAPPELGFCSIGAARCFTTRMTRTGFARARRRLVATCQSPKPWSWRGCSGRRANIRMSSLPVGGTTVRSS